MRHGFHEIPIGLFFVRVLVLGVVLLLLNGAATNGYTLMRDLPVTFVAIGQMFAWLFEPFGLITYLIVYISSGWRPLIWFGPKL